MSAAGEHDYIIVGGGAAGCVLAARLSEDPDTSVLLLEAGGAGGSPLIGIPGANVVTGTNPRLNWNYQTEPDPGLGGRSLYWSQGRLLGGGGAINGMMYLRGQKRDYDGWAAAGCPGWSWDEVLPLFRRAETNERGPSDLHGGDGPLPVSRGRATAPVAELFLAAAAERGHPLTDDHAAAPALAFGHVDMSIGRGRRSSTASAYLAPARRRANLAVLTRAQATRVILEKGRARGVDFLHRGRPVTARAAREVILAGGAVNSPQLLMLSGIGPAEALGRLGIAVVADAPEVGANLQNHPMYRLLYTTTKPVTAYAHLGPRGLLRAGAQYLARRGGVLAQGLFTTAGFLRADPADPATEMQLMLAPALVIRRGPGVLGVLPQQHGFTLLLNHGVPLSRGRVALVSADPLRPAAIHPGYFSDPRDIEVLAAGVEQARALVAAPALAGVVGDEVQPRGPIRGRDDIRADIRATTVTNYHPGGTCRMGSDAGAVLDPALRVRGVEGLRVADASVMPRMVNANTFATAVMIGEKAADLIRA